MFGGTLGGPIKKNKIFSFTSFEQWDDSRPLTIVRTVPTELERRGDFSQSVAQRPSSATIYNPFTSDPRPGHGPRGPHAVRRQRHSAGMFDPTALKMLQDIPLPNLPGQRGQPAGQRGREGELLEPLAARGLQLQRHLEGLRALRPVHGRLYQSESAADAGFFPLSGSNRDGMSIAGDAVWIMSNKTTLNVRGSFYNMIDEFYNPDLLLGARRAGELLAEQPLVQARSTTAATCTIPRST